MWLCLEPDTDVLDRRGEDRIHYSRECACRPVLAVRERLRLGCDFVDGFVLFGCIPGFECAASVVEAAELDRDAGADADQGC